MNSIQYAGEFLLKELKIHTSSGTVLDITKQVASVDLYEDIFSTAMSGEVAFLDVDNLTENGPILGQEFMTLKITTPSLDEEEINFTNASFVIHKLGTKIDANANTQLIVLKFTTPELIRNKRVRVSKSYTDSIDKIVESIMRDKRYINTNKNLYIEPTAGIRKVISPNYHPYDFITNLATDALNKKYASSYFLFFENTKGIHFRTLQSLYNSSTVAYFNDGDAGTVLNEGRTRDLEKEFNTALSYEPATQNDMLANVMGGLLGSTFIEYNLFHKKYAVKEYGYFDNFGDFERVNAKDKSRDNPIYSEGSIDDLDNNVGDFKSARIFLQPTSINESNQSDAIHYNTNTSSYSFKPNNKIKSISQNMAKMFELNSTISATMQVNGHCNLAAGRIVQVSRPAGGPGEFDDEFTGKFLITKLRHIFDQGTRKHEVLMHVAKDSSVGVDNGPVKQPKGRKQPVIDLSEY